MNRYVLHRADCLEPVYEGTYRECQKRRTEIKKEKPFFVTAERPVYEIELYEEWKAKDDAERARVEAVLDQEEAEREAFYAEHGKSEPVLIGGQCNLFGSMAPALMPGDTVRSHGAALTFDDLMKRQSALVLMDINGALTVCCVGDCVSVPGGRMYQRPRRMIKIECCGMTLELFRADMKGDNATRIYEL